MRKILNAPPPQIHGIMRGKKDSLNPKKFVNIKYSGISVTTDGSIMVAIQRPKMNFLNRNFNLANENAHSIAVVVPNMTAGTTIIKVFRRYVK